MAGTPVRNWSDLPSDLLIKILGCLNARVYHLLLRSVCPAWRSFLPLSGVGRPIQLRLPSDLVSKVQEKIYFLVSSPQNQLHKWVVYVKETEANKWTFFNPLTGEEFYFPSEAKTGKINLLDYRIAELGRSRTLQLGDDSTKESRSLYHGETKVCKLLVCLPSASKYPSALLTLSTKGGLLFFQPGFEKWVDFDPLEAFDVDLVFDDIISFKGGFYAVDGKGRLVMFDPLSSQEPVLAVTCPLDIDRGRDEINLYLVESEGSLYLVARRRVHSLDYLGDSTYVATKLHVFVLKQEKGRDAKWDEVRSIGDRVFLVGQDSTFSVSSSTSVLNESGCIYFRRGEGWGLDAGMYDLNTGEFEEFNGSDDPDSRGRLFWPPPSWICDWDPDMDPSEWMFDWLLDPDPYGTDYLAGPYEYD